MTETPHLIAVDLDDTALDNMYTLNGYTAETLVKLREMGHRVMIATARPYCLANHFYRELGLDTLLCLCNGAYLYLPDSQSFVPVVNEVPPDTVAAALELIAPLEPEAVWIENDDDLYITNYITSSYFKEVSSKSRVHKMELPDMAGLPAGRLIIICKRKPGFPDVLRQVQTIAGIQCEHRDWQRKDTHDYLNISAVGADKWHAVSYTANYYGIPAENIVTFGDEWNDLLMITRAAKGFAMRNGSPRLREAAANVTVRVCNEGGVGHELTRLFLK